MKVFGYRDSEISHLYIRSITLCVAVSLVLSLPVIIGSLTAIFRSMLLAYNGNIEIYVPAWSMAACVGIGFATYLVVARYTRAPSSASAWPKPSRCRSSHRGQSLPIRRPGGKHSFKSVPNEWLCLTSTLL